MLVAGAKAVVGLAHEINKKVGKKQVTTLDIGGGLPVDYGFDKSSSSRTLNFKAYAQLLKQEVPELWEGTFKIITEFGRSLVSRHGFTCSRA